MRWTDNSSCTNYIVPPKHHYRICRRCSRRAAQVASNECTLADNALSTEHDALCAKDNRAPRHLISRNRSYNIVLLHKRRQRRQWQRLLLLHWQRQLQRRMHMWRYGALRNISTIKWYLPLSRVSRRRRRAQWQSASDYLWRNGRGCHCDARAVALIIHIVRITKMRRSNRTCIME